MYIVSERLILRDFQHTDISDLFEIFGDAETMRHVEPPFTLEKTRRFLEGFCIVKRGAFAAVEQSSGKVVGYILFNSVSGNGVFEIGWVFNRKFWGNGYAYEICSELLMHAFCEMSAHKVFAETIDKQKSVRLMRKLGMKREGVQRKHERDCNGEWADLYYYGILNEEFVRKLKREKLFKGNRKKEAIS